MIYPSTWEYLLGLTRESNQHGPLILFCYYMLHDGEAPTNVLIKEATGLNDETIKASRETLYELGFITITKQRNNRNMVELADPPLLTFRVANTVLLSKFNIRYERGKADIRDSESKLFVLSDVEADEDWKKAEPILAKYFKSYQYNPAHLVTKKQYFGPFIELVTESEVDFDAYCKWYRVEKYPTKKFVYGLFLHPGVIAEYRDTLEEDETSRYANTSKMNQSDSFKESLKKTDEFIASLEDDDEG